MDGQFFAETDVASYKNIDITGGEVKVYGRLFS